MIGVFIGKIRIGSILHFPVQRYWVAYSYGDTYEQFKTKKAAIAWLEQRHKEKERAA